MADDIADLKARVDAAREQLVGDTALVQKVELRLNDLAHIVEGSLARQSAELQAAQERLAALEEDLARALARAEQAGGEAARAERLGRDNGELRHMVMALLEIIEGRQKSPLAAVMQQLEENVSALLAAPPAEPLAEAAPELEPEPESPAQTPQPPESTSAIVAEAISPADSAEFTPSAADDDAEADPAAQEVDAVADEVIETEPVVQSLEIDDLSEIALYDAAEEVVEPDRG